MALRVEPRRPAGDGVQGVQERRAEGCMGGLPLFLEFPRSLLQEGDSVLGGAHLATCACFLLSRGCFPQQSRRGPAQAPLHS